MTTFAFVITVLALAATIISIIYSKLAIREAKKSTAESILFGLQAIHKQIKTVTEHLQVYLNGEVRNIIPQLSSALHSDTGDIQKIGAIIMRLSGVVEGIEKTLDPICKDLQAAHENLRDYIRIYNKDYDKSEESCQ